MGQHVSNTCSRHARTKSQTCFGHETWHWPRIQQVEVWPWYPGHFCLGLQYSANGNKQKTTYFSSKSLWDAGALLIRILSISYLDLKAWGRWLIFQLPVLFSHKRILLEQLANFLMRNSRVLGRNELHKRKSVSQKTFAACGWPHEWEAQQVQGELAKPSGTVTLLKTIWLIFLDDL